VLKEPTAMKSKLVQTRRMSLLDADDEPVDETSFKRF